MNTDYVAVLQLDLFEIYIQDSWAAISILNNACVEIAHAYEIQQTLHRPYGSRTLVF